ncbi:GNAT family N-acetyltransferase [Rhizobium binxianense]
MNTVRLDEHFGRWDELLALILASFAYMNGRIDPPSSAPLLTPEALAQKARAEIGYAALDGDALRGCMFLRPEADCLYLGKLAIAPQAQGRGIGRQLLTVAETVAAELGLRSIRLDTRIELTGNHAVFGAWGFVRTAEKSHPGFDRVTYVEMRKVLARLDRP